MFDIIAFAFAFLQFLSYVCHGSGYLFACIAKLIGPASNAPNAQGAQGAPKRKKNVKNAQQRKRIKRNGAPNAQGAPNYSPNAQGKRGINYEWSRRLRPKLVVSQ
jgi:hypothetical protein